MSWHGRDGCRGRSAAHPGSVVVMERTLTTGPASVPTPAAPTCARRRPPAVRLAGVTKSFGEVQAVRGVDLVRNHLSAAIGKTGARTRAEAVRIADENGCLLG